MTPARLKEISARRKAITEGAWTFSVSPISHEPVTLYSVDEDEVDIDIATFEEWTSTEMADNAKFIVHAPGDIDDCLAEIERLHPIETALRDLYNDCRNESCDAQRGAVMDRARKLLEAE